SGAVASFEAAFGVRLEQYQYAAGSYRGRTGPVHVPADLADVVEGVFGLDDRPQAVPHFKRGRTSEEVQAHAASTTFAPTQLARLYDFPTGVDGHGQCIGIVELGGAFRTADIRTYFTRLGLPAPHITTVLVDHAHMRSDDAD